MTKGDSLPSGIGNWGSSESLSPELLRRKANKLGELADKCQRLNSVVGGIVVESKEQVDDIIILHFAFVAYFSYLHISFSLHLNVLRICIFCMFCIIAFLKEQLQVNDILHFAFVAYS